MFWSSFADSYNVGGKIEMSSMDGTSREVLAAKNVNGHSGSIYWPVSLTYYKSTNKLYWLDVLSQTIDSITLDGSRIREQRKVGAFHSQSMAVISGKIFWTDNLKNRIEVAPIDSDDFKRYADYSQSHTLLTFTSLLTVILKSSMHHRAKRHFYEKLISTTTMITLRQNCK